MAEGDAANDMEPGWLLGPRHGCTIYFGCRGGLDSGKPARSYLPKGVTNTIIKEPGFGRGRDCPCDFGSNSAVERYSARVVGSIRMVRAPRGVCTVWTNWNFPGAVPRA